jgi:hypothetical protein
MRLALSRPGCWGASVGGFKDSSVVRAMLRAGNVSLLHNRSEVVRVRDQSVRFAGMGDLWSDGGDGDLAFADVRAEDPAIRPEVTVLDLTS